MGAAGFYLQNSFWQERESFKSKCQDETFPTKGTHKKNHQENGTLFQPPITPSPPKNNNKNTTTIAVLNFTAAKTNFKQGS